jgi:predicted dienelactone hydrolase
VRARFALVALVLCAVPAGAASGPAACMRGSGKAATRCLRSWVTTVATCRLAVDPACEAAARAAGGPLEAALAAAEDAGEASCTDATAEALGYVDLADVGLRTHDSCADFGDDLLDVTFADSPAGGLLGCQKAVSRGTTRLRNGVVRAFGNGCYLAAFAGGRCDRARRDRRVDRLRRRVGAQIVRGCGDAFDALALVPPDAGATLDARVDALLAIVLNRARHFAQRAFPPNDLGPTADFGPYPIGVRTLALADPSRLNVEGTGSRPVTVEVYYPSTPAAVAGVPRDVVQVFGLDIVTTPAYRDVDRAPGTFPLVLFSHGNDGIRFQSFFFTAHLASHGFVVVTPDHHGNTFVDQLLGIVDPLSAVNRPLDMSFLIDQFLAFDGEAGNFFEGAVDPARIGLSGHSFGGYTSFAIAGGTFGLGTFTDARVKAILPQAPAANAFPDAFFGTITVPTLIVGGSIDETTEFAENQQRPFDHLPAGAAVVGLAELVDAGHFTFSDFCEVPRNLLAFLGGFDEACEPRHLPWRHAHDMVNYLSLNFFDGVLNGNPEALARLSPATLAGIEDLVWQSR